MDPTRDMQSTVLGRLQRSGKKQLRTVQHYFDRRHLEASLASLLQAANGHEGRGLAPGSALYLVLNRESQLLTTAHCQRWHVSPEQLQAQLPALAKLAQLAQPRPPRATISKVVLVVLAVFATSVLIGLAAWCLIAILSELPQTERRWSARTIAIRSAPLSLPGVAAVLQIQICVPVACHRVQRIKHRRPCVR